MFRFEDGIFPLALPFLILKTPQPTILCVGFLHGFGGAPWTGPWATWTSRYLWAVVCSLLSFGLVFQAARFPSTLLQKLQPAMFETRWYAVTRVIYHTLRMRADSQLGHCSQEEIVQIAASDLLISNDLDTHDGLTKTEDLKDSYLKTRDVRHALITQVADIFSLADGPSVVERDYMC